MVGKNQIEGCRGPWINIIVGGPFKLGGKNQIERTRGPWFKVIVGGPFKYYC